MNVRFMCILGLIALGCSTSQGEQVQALPAVSAPPPTSAAADIQACLSLVGSERFREAIPVCRRAQKADPTDVIVRGALDYAERAR
jgi:hypothetical protein